MRLVYFAEVRELVGQSEETLTPPPDITRLSELVAWMAQRGGGYAHAMALENMCFAINQEFATSECSLEGANEVAFFPPVSGG